MNNRVAKRLRTWYYKNIPKEKQSKKMFRRIKKLYSEGSIRLKKD